MARINLARKIDRGKKGLFSVVSVNEPLLKYVTMDILRLEKNETVTVAAMDRELGIVINSGNLLVKSDLGNTELQCRQDQFSGLPHGIYLPCGASVKIKALSKLQAAIYGTPAKRRMADVTIVQPDDIKVLKIGEGNWRLEGFFILGTNVDAYRLIVGETWVPEGHWSSCPPHSHDKNIPGKESKLEEIYYFRFNPTQGFGFQGIYTDDCKLDEAYIIRDESVILIPRGYHPNVTGPGYAMRMQWGMAGPERSWRTFEDPDHSWLARKAVGGVKEHNF